MAISQAMCTSFKVELLSGGHNFNTANVARSANTQDSFKMALYTSSASLGAATTAYTASGETSGTGYAATGQALTVSAVPQASGTTAILNFSTETWSTASITARGALIYNTSSAVTNAAVAVLDFGGDKTATSGTFTVQFPAATTSAAILRISG